MRSLRRWADETAGGLPATFWYLWTGTLINRIGSFVVVVLAIYLTAERGLSVAYTGLVLGMYGAGGAAGVLAGGVLADRWGRRPTLLAAHVGAAAAMLALGLARHAGAIAACALVLGVFAEAVRPAFSAMMVDVVPERDRLRAFNLNYWAINLGFACSAVLAGFAAQANYLLLFVVDAATTLVTAAIVLARVRETRPAGPVVSGTPGRAGLGTVLGDRVFMILLALNVPIAVIFLQPLSTLAIAMGRDGLSPASYGSVIALNGVLIVTGQLFLARLARRSSRSRTLAVASAVLGLGFALTALADTAAAYALTVLIWTVGEMLHAPASATLIAELSPTEMRGRYQGVFSLSWSVAAFAAPILGGSVQQHLGGVVLWLGCGVVGGLVAVAHLISGPARERRIADLRGERSTTAPIPALAGAEA